MSDVLAEVTREGLVESCHYGDVAVVDETGRLLLSVGDPHRFTFIRSASKPLQALPLLESGAADKFGITDKEMAVIVASHNGETEHLEAVASILGKIGFSPEDLACGPREPLGGRAARELAFQQRMPECIHNNCSGKHAGILALCTYLGLDTEGYKSVHHPVQGIILEAVSSMAEYPSETMGIGVDGCGVPTFALPLYNMALAYARMARPEGLPNSRRDAVMRVAKAMMNNPYMVAGEGRLCTEIMTLAPGRFLAKSGAEGIYCLASMDSGFGLALKIGDGSHRATAPVLVRLLTHLGVLGESEVLARKNRSVKVKNAFGETVGEIRPAFIL